MKNWKVIVVAIMLTMFCSCAKQQSRQYQPQMYFQKLVTNGNIIESSERTMNTVLIFPELKSNIFTKLANFIFNEKQKHPKLSEEAIDVIRKDYCIIDKFMDINYNNASEWMIGKYLILEFSVANEGSHGMVLGASENFRTVPGYLVEIKKFTKDYRMVYGLVDDIWIQLTDQSGKRSVIPVSINRVSDGRNEIKLVLSKNFVERINSVIQDQRSTGQGNQNQVINTREYIAQETAHYLEKIPTYPEKIEDIRLGSKAVIPDQKREPSHKRYYNYNENQDQFYYHYKRVYMVPGGVIKVVNIDTTNNREYNPILLIKYRNPKENILTSFLKYDYFEKYYIDAVEFLGLTKAYQKNCQEKEKIKEEESIIKSLLSKHYYSDEIKIPSNLGWVDVKNLDPIKQYISDEYSGVIYGSDEYSGVIYGDSLRVDKDGSLLIRGETEKQYLVEYICPPGHQPENTEAPTGVIFFLEKNKIQK